ncbi:MAG: GNAT family N-acetyltransferase [Candidatus Thermoplasmatota archaeon]|jgi:RimJ/RimL family protein N-acetyltransferase|nr:GNAT family N-acetyltransferase [Candidatus Thermoplasmatota archaeon]
MIRELQWTDMDDLVENYYSFYDELKEAPDFGIIFYQKKPDYESEVEWFSALYRRVKEGNALAVVAEEDGKIVGLCDAHRLRPGSEISHAAVLGITIKKEYRGRGLGFRMIQKVIELSRGKFEMLKLEVFSVNSVAMNLYRRLGFVEYGMLPGAIKRGNVYFDSVHMYYKVK